MVDYKKYELRVKGLTLTYQDFKYIVSLDIRNIYLDYSSTTMPEMIVIWHPSRTLLSKVQRVLQLRRRSKYCRLRETNQFHTSGFRGDCGLYKAIIEQYESKKEDEALDMTEEEIIDLLLAIDFEFQILYQEFLEINSIINQYEEDLDLNPEEEVVFEFLANKGLELRADIDIAIKATV